MTKAEKTSVAYAYAHSQLDKMLAARNFENGDFVVSGEGIFRAELSVSSVTSLMQKGRYVNSSFWQIQIKVYDKEIRNTRLPLVVLEQLVTLDRLSND
ncbi:hypothetical protein [Pseudovibrio denitrificans]|uniref:hypothetical protein n=1 Tax=Pseudovibrio denitrificans TaxID=258256 RepID=UPI001FCC6F3A|nr:hypothetical protein [Pseudovibrio denitrificans]